ncbi:hypothetical protein AX15_002646 [Amanita polypyramis BW_CC]|nr:hypothetical protein AX15_002646 [Amanita polypyramis BW_CC]
MLTRLPYDVVCEILSHLSVPDVLRIRRVCKFLAQLTYERTTWGGVYERSRLLLEDPTLNQSSGDLERALVRASKLALRWTAHPKAPAPISSRCLYESHPMFALEVALVCSRYLLAVERKKLCLYDSDPIRRDDLKSPLLTRQACWEWKLNTACGMLCHETNVHQDTVYVTYTQKDTIAIVKIHLSDDRPKSELVTEIPAQAVVKMYLRSNFLFFVEDSISAHHLARLYHIPTERLYDLPIHELVPDPADLEYLQVYITETLLILMHSDPFDEVSTCTEVYELPHSDLDAGVKLSCSHRGRLPLSFAVAEPLHCGGAENHLVSAASTIFLALAHTDHKSAEAYLLEIVLSPSGKILFNTLVSTPVDIDTINLRQTKLFSSSRAGNCLAVSCTLGSSVYNSYYVQYGRHGNRIDITTLCPPEEDNSNRHIIGFDGFGGRLCWIRGWCPSRVYITEYV